MRCPGALRRALFAVAFLLVGGGSALSAYAAATSPPARPPAPPLAVTTHRPGNGPGRAPGHGHLAGSRVVGITPVPASPPVRIAIPAIGLSSPLGPPRGVTPAGTVADAPLSGPVWGLPWWYDRGPSPGQPGAAVILGHVDSALGQGHFGAFFCLGTLRPGQPITVVLANGSITRWRTVSDVLYPDTRFPDATVYERSGPPLLHLVTCGGAFNWSTHHYEAAVVVTAELVGVSGP